ncbi:hypothetical protein N9B98_00360 [bacterium]|nr:hypothetical protein [bacterium]
MALLKTCFLISFFALTAGITSSRDLIAQDNIVLCDPCMQHGWNADFELGILQWYLTRDPGSIEQENRTGTGTYRETPEGDYAAAPRIALSYLDSSGVGLRGTYFSYDGDSGMYVDPSDETMQFKVGLWSTDYEMLFAKNGPRCSSLFSAGVRVMSFNFEELQGEAGGSIIDFHRESKFTGYGPTAALELRRPGGILTPFVKLRASVLYGDLEREDLLTGNQISDWESGLETYFESQLGLECRKAVGCGQWFFRTGLEAHYAPLLGTVSETGSDHEEDNMAWGLIGCTFSTGFRF